MYKSLKFQPFTPSEYAEYKSWYEDARIKRALGYVDEEWLNYVLKDEEGQQFAVFRNDLLVAVVGITRPGGKERYAVITDMAIRPTLRRRGLGSAILAQLYDTIDLAPDEYWVSYVQTFNVGAQRFFERNGWSRTEDKDMIRYEYGR